MSSWDEFVLKEELQFLSTFDVELVTFTGFNSAEIDVLLNAPEKNPITEPDKAIPPLPDRAVSCVWDVWVFKGEHRLGCLNALEATSYEALLSEEKAGLVLCDPPYNVPIGGNVSRRTGAREFCMASGEMSGSEFTSFLRTCFGHLSRYATDGSLSLQFMDFRHMQEMLAAGHEVYGNLLNLCVWAKTNAGMGPLWRSQHELCFVWKNGTALHVNNVALGRHGRNRSNVWSYPGGNVGACARDREEREHVTPKNAQMIQDAILDVSRRGEIVLDVFAGSSTTLVAADRSKRRGYGMELDHSTLILGSAAWRSRPGPRRAMRKRARLSPRPQRSAASCSSDRVGADEARTWPRSARGSLIPRPRRSAMAGLRRSISSNLDTRAIPGDARVSRSRR